MGEGEKWAEVYFPVLYCDRGYIHWPISEKVLNNVVVEIRWRKLPFTQTWGNVIYMYTGHRHHQVLDCGLGWSAIKPAFNLISFPPRLHSTILKSTTRWVVFTALGALRMRTGGKTRYVGVTTSPFHTYQPPPNNLRAQNCLIFHIFAWFLIN